MKISMEELMDYHDANRPKYAKGLEVVRIEYGSNFTKLYYNSPAKYFVAKHNKIAAYLETKKHLDVFNFRPDVVKSYIANLKFNQ